MSTRSSKRGGPIPLLQEGLRPHELRLERRHIDGLAAEWPKWIARQEGLRSSPQHLQLTRFIASRIHDLMSRVAELRDGQINFARRFALMVSVSERQELVLDYARELGALPGQLRGDARAFNRWFGPDAVQDRARVQISQSERMLCFLLQSLGRIAVGWLKQSRDISANWDELRIEETVAPLLAWEGDARVRIEAFRSLSTVLQAPPAEFASQAMLDTTVAYVYRAALDRRLDVWIQREALLLVSVVAFDQLESVIEARLREPIDGDDLFVRRYAVQLLGQSLERSPQLERLLAVALTDPSPFVRQAVAESLVMASDFAVMHYWPVLGLNDPVVQVRAKALLQLPSLLRNEAMTTAAGSWLVSTLVNETLAFGLRVGLKSAEDCALKCGAGQVAWLDTLLPAIEQLHTSCPTLAVRRWAAETRERILCLADPQSLALAERIGKAARKIQPSRSGVINDIPADPDQIGRALAFLAQRDHGLALEPGRRGWRTRRGHKFGFRTWRFLHEWRNPSPDKRQAFQHTIGRHFRGTIRAPSGILAELAQTKVPGEPLHMASEAGWRPYLPLVDELISLLDESTSEGPLRLYTAEGVTEVLPPADLRGRLAARITLTKKFQTFAEARNWNEGSAAHPANYARLLREVGFELRFFPYLNTLPDSAVTRFFPGLAALPLPELTNRIQNYFFSAYDNTLFDLSVFATLAIAGVVGHHVWINTQMRRNRNAIPLVVGGWGTRGKSGTERLKAAMFNAQGYSVVSKTTGCEAMFLYSPPQGELREMFLFRPYDKATIWEQFNVVRIARKLGCEVFLWECMALTPSFVRLLQRSWMRDDFITLTNTFPDHEDLQGPAGIDIPKVMTEFIPRGRVLLTTEEQMRPILQETADDLGTELKGVGWLESGLIAPDVLARFPYQEHPDNIALVTALGAELGIGHDFAVKAMADRVVLDLGVLKTFAPASLNARVLEFSNGMSANERYGCLGNWKRLGFDVQDPLKDPGTMISTVVNNRADRIARSRVFAGVLIQDIRADFHVLIGNNLDGLKGYLRETWDAWAQNLTLWPEQGGEGGAHVVWESLARNFRIVHSPAQVAARLGVMLKGIGADPSLVAQAGQIDTLKQLLSQAGKLAHVDEVIAFHQRDLEMLQEFGALLQRCELAGSTPEAELDQAMRAQLWQWFERRVVVVGDYYATGDAVIAAIRDSTPPGFHNRVMGMQNIKGTGLDFVYRWLAWDTCSRACEDMVSPDAKVRKRGVDVLIGFQEFGLLSQTKVLHALATVRESPAGSQDRVRAELAVIESNLESRLHTVLEGINAQRSTGIMEKVFDGLEGYVDATDAVRRRRRADRIYKDLVTRRISEARAVLELQAITRRQKGGWLSYSINSLIKQMRQRLRV